MLYLTGIYLFHCGVRCRYQLSLSRHQLDLICLHILLLGVAMYGLSAIYDDPFLRLPIVIASFCLPIVITFALIRKQQRPGNLGDRVLLLCTALALVMLPLLYPVFGYLIPPDHQGQLMVMTLVTLTLEILCIGGLAISYIYDLIDKLRADANTDKLTQSRNRRYFFKVAPQFQQRASAGEVISLVLLDIDHFKRFNDSFGHQAGDAVLSHFAAMLRQRLSRADLIVRYGGEEFWLVLSGKTPQQTAELLQAFQCDLRQAPLLYDEQSLPVTASYGVAALRKAEAIEHCVHRADLALYQAKANGRDGVVLDPADAAGPAS